MSSTALCLLIVQAMVLVTFTDGAGPAIAANPTDISLGISSSLEVNCTFSLSENPDMAAFVSLIISRSNSSREEFLELAAVTEFHPDSATLLTEEDASASGVHSNTGESFVNIRWEYPLATQAGVYQCVAHGMDDLGHTVELKDTTVVLVDQANLNDIFDKLKEIQHTQANMENMVAGMSGYIQTLEYNVSHLISYANNLEQTVALLRPLEVLNLLGTYQNSDYYVSKEGFGDVYKVTNVCEKYGGQLLEIDNREELKVIEGFLSDDTSFDQVLIAGSDEAAEGQWVLPSSNTPVPFTEWKSGQPDGGTSENCLMLVSNVSSWLMSDADCISDPPVDDIRYICEIPRP